MVKEHQRDCEIHPGGTEPPEETETITCNEPHNLLQGCGWQYVDAMHLNVVFLVRYGRQEGTVEESVGQWEGHWSISTLFPWHVLESQKEFWSAAVRRAKHQNEKQNCQSAKNSLAL